MPQFNGQNNKKTDPRWFLNETVEKTKLEQLEEVLTEQQVLRRGMRERDPNGPIHQLQTALKTLNLYAGEVDGVYGGGTRDAVRAFQKKQVEAGNIPAKNKRGRSNIDGIAGPVTIGAIASASGSSGLGSFFQKLKTTFFGKEQPKSAPKAKKPQNRKVAMTNAMAARLQSDLSGYVDEDEMKNVVKVLANADKMGILSAVSQKYMSMTGDGLQATIRGVSGVAGPKNQALALLGGKKAERDIATITDDTFKKVQSGLTRNLAKFGAKLHHRGFLAFLGFRDNPWTENDLTQSEKKWLKNFLTNLTSGAYENNKRISKTARRRLAKERKNWEKTGVFRFHAGGLGKCPATKNYSGGSCAYEIYRVGTKAGEEVGISYGKAGKKQSVKALFTDPSKAAQFEKFLGQFTFRGKDGSFSIVDNYDFNDFEKAKNEKQAKKILDKRMKGIADATKDKDFYRFVRNSAPLYAKATKFRGYPVKITV